MCNIFCCNVNAFVTLSILNASFGVEIGIGIGIEAPHARFIDTDTDSDPDADLKSFLDKYEPHV